MGYASYGDPNGAPVLYCHGFPGSRLEARVYDRAGAELGVRVIGIDRPGMGLSEFVAGRRLVDWTGEVVAVADILGLDRFALLGMSGGGPYAACCASGLPERVTAVGIVGGLAPLDSEGIERWLTDQQRKQRAGLSTLRRLPVLTRLVAMQTARRMTGNPAAVRDTMAEVDRAVLDDTPALAEGITASMHEAFRQGSKGFAQDLRSVFTDQWGFRLDRITLPVHLWHGELDNNVFVANGRYLATTIPGCHATFVPGEGHLLFSDRTREILTAIAEPSPAA